MLSGRPVFLGHGAAGCRGASLLGVFGSKGVYSELILTYLTREVRCEHFDDVVGNISWFVLAQDRNKWHAFISGVEVM